MHIRFARIGILSMLLAALLAFTACSGAQQLNNQGQNNVSISVWTYYNGDQLAAFQNTVAQFNETVGKDEGIVVESYNLGSVNDLQDAVIDSANGKVGANPVPNMFAAYADTAYAIDQMGLLADLGPYLNQDERDLFIDGYLEEGTLGGEDSIKIFPVAKSVEVMVLNETDFEPFAQATNTSYDELATFEGIAKVAERYYEWTDDQTPEEGDGKAFFGTDAMANYFYIGAKQLGVDIAKVENGRVKLDFDKRAVRKLWDNYYVPFVKGYYDASGRYRSDDIKTGNIICLLGSSSGATYFPREVTNEAGETHEIGMRVLPAPQFEGGEAWAVQQGAGMVVVNTSDEEVQACITFLEWFASPEQNLRFSVESGYLPVMKSANNIDEVHKVEGELDERMNQVLEVGFATVEDNKLYTPQAFENGAEFRQVLETSLIDRATADAAEVRKQVQQGVALNQAAAPFTSDDYFDEWYEETLSTLQSLTSSS